MQIHDDVEALGIMRDRCAIKKYNRLHSQDRTEIRSATQIPSKILMIFMWPAELPPKPVTVTSPPISKPVRPFQPIFHSPPTHRQPT